MSNWAPINSKLTAIDGDNHDCSSSELPTGQAVPTDALSSGYSNAMDTQSSASPTPPVSHPYYGVASPIPRPSAPTPWQLGPPPPNGIDDIKPFVLSPSATYFTHGLTHATGYQDHKSRIQITSLLLPYQLLIRYVNRYVCRVCGQPTEKTSLRVKILEHTRREIHFPQTVAYQLIEYRTRSISTPAV